SMTDLQTLGGPNSEAHGINDAGQIVGVSDKDAVNRAFLYSDGEMTDLGTLPGGSFSNAYAINNGGQVTGTATVSGSATHAFLWDSDNGMQDLGTLGGSNSFGVSINASGEVVGYSNYPLGGNFKFHAFVSSGGAMSDLNDLISGGSGWTLTYARGINDA